MKPLKYSVPLPLSKIRQSPYHFRKETANEKLDDLAASIKEVGLIHAISVVENQDGTYELINGHRRFLAHKRAKLGTVRANIYTFEPEELKDARKQQQAVVQFLLAANSQEPLIPVERARYYAEAMEKFNWEPADIARVHHVTVDAVMDDLLFLNLTEETLDLVQAHMDSFSMETLRVLAEHSSPSARKAWAMTPTEQVEVATAIAHQRDKRLVESPRALRAHIQDIVKNRRSVTAAANRRLGSNGDDPVKALFKLLESAQKAVEPLTKADLSGIKEIEPADKGAAYSALLQMADSLIKFADGPITQLKAKGSIDAKAKAKVTLKTMQPTNAKAPVRAAV